MKNLFGKILVGVAGCAMAIGMNAFAAEIAIDTPTVNTETGAVTISGTITGDAESLEATIIVVEKDVSLLTVEDAQIKYIDQETAQSGTFSYDFKLTTGKIYDVYCGGTDVTAPAKDEINLTSESSGTLKIVGTVSIISGADMSKVTAVAGDVAGTVDTDTGAYTIEVEPGTYAVVIGRSGYLYRTFSDVEVSDVDVDLGATTLLAGDVVVDDKDVVNLTDLTDLLANYLVTDADELYDLNDDGSINLTDLTALLSSYLQSYDE